MDPDKGNIKSDIKPSLIELSRVYDPRGNLSVVEEFRDVPFEIKRVFWIYDVPGGENRGGHSHKTLYQFIVATSGSFQVNVTDGVNKNSFFLNHPFIGVLIPPGFWATQEDFSSGAVCMVLASEYYDEDDYIRNYDDFLKWKEISK
ncbi:MAG: WxcM-like domain-containing protein [Muribaculaceae bacterium]|nr:WxcM-like domain-containing protein [Muribaculaceae bacterium]